MAPQKSTETYSTHRHTISSSAAYDTVLTRLNASLKANEKGFGTTSARLANFPSVEAFTDHVYKFTGLYDFTHFLEVDCDPWTKL